MEGGDQRGSVEYKRMRGSKKAFQVKHDGIKHPKQKKPDSSQERSEEFYEGALVKAPYHSWEETPEKIDIETKDGRSDGKMSSQNRYRSLPCELSH